MKPSTIRYEGKPICARWLMESFGARLGAVTAHKERTAPALARLTIRAVSAKVARYVAENCPGGAVIHWQDDECEFAHVYGR